MVESDGHVRSVVVRESVNTTKSKIHAVTVKGQYSASMISDVLCARSVKVLGYVNMGVKKLTAKSVVGSACASMAG